MVSHTQGVHPITEGAYITLSNLRAGGGKLYYGSIASGKDEVHCYDLLARREYRVTASQYGSFDPAPAENKVLVTTYDRLGYRPAVQSLADSALIPVVPARLPVDLVNPPRERWPVVNLDTVRFTAADSLRQAGEFRTKRYRKAPNLVNVHSWMPVAFDPFSAVEEHVIDANIGVRLCRRHAPVAEPALEHRGVRFLRLEPPRGVGFPARGALFGPGGAFRARCGLRRQSGPLFAV